MLQLNNVINELKGKEMSKQMPLNEYCDWLEDLTTSGDAINSKGLQNWIERYAEEYHQSKVNNVVLDDVNNGFYCHDELVNNMLNHNGGKCKEQCKSCINDMQEK
jgi:hypothetical protein